MRRALLAAFGAVTLLGSSAFAQSDAESRAAAEVLFREGMAAFNAGNYAEACPKLESAVALTGGEALGGVLALAGCHEKQGKIASAWAAFSEVAGKARAAGQTARAGEAESGAAALLPKLHYMILRVPAELAATEGVQILRQGKPFRRELWGARLPVDPGAIAFEVTAPAKVAAKVTVQIPQTPGETPIALQPLADAQVAAPPASAAVAVAPSNSASAGPSAPVKAVASSPLLYWNGPRTTGVVMMGLGATALGIGIALGGMAKDSYEGALADPANDCSELGAGGYACADPGPVRGARALGDAGTAVAAGGIGFAVGGALLFLLWPSQPRHAPSAELVPRVTVGQGGFAFTWTGAF